VLFGKWFIPAILLVFSSALYAASEEEKLIQRISPAGSVCMIGDACAGSAPVASAGGASGPNDPEQIYNTYCVACHGSGANNSPIMGDAAAWAPRLDKEWTPFTRMPSTASITAQCLPKGFVWPVLMKLSRLPSTISFLR